MALLPCYLQNCHHANTMRPAQLVAVLLAAVLAIIVPGSLAARLDAMHKGAASADAPCLLGRCGADGMATPRNLFMRFLV